MTNTELLQKKVELKAQIKEFDAYIYQWINKNIIPEIKEKFNTDFDFRLTFEVKDDYFRGAGDRIVSKQYYLDGEVKNRDRGGYSFHMSCYREKEFHFSPSMGSCYPVDIERYADFLAELTNFAKQAKAFDDFIWNHPALNAEAEKKFQLRIELAEVEAQILNNLHQIKVEYIEQKFKENNGTIKISNISNRSGRTVHTEFISFKKFQNKEVYVKDSKGSTVICTVDGLFKSLGGKEDGMV